MKKFLVVLTILVLVAGFAFAAVTGYVEAKYKFDFTDAKLLTYDINGKHSKVSFTVSTEQAKVDGTTKPYATVTVDVKLSATFVEKEQLLDYAGYEWGIDATKDKFTFGVVLSDFRIVGENWEIDFLKAVAAGDYAKSAWEIDNTADKNPLDAKWDFGKSKGITVTYDGYKVGVSAERRTAADDAKVALRAESKELTFAEGVTGQAAVGIGATKKAGESMSFDFGASVKAAYAKDDLTVNAAADLQYVGKNVDADVAVKVAVKPVTVDVYYANKLDKPRKHNLVVGDVKNVLSLRAVAVIEKVTVTVLAEDVANADRLLAVKEEATFGKLTEDAQFGIYPTLDKVPLLGWFLKNVWFANAGASYAVQENLSVNAHVGYMSMNGDLVILGGGKFHTSDLVFKVGAEYKLEKVTVSADAYVGKSFTKEEGKDAENSDLLFACELGAKSETLVENAVLSATLHLDKKGVIGLYKDTLVDAYDDDPETGAGSMYFQVACKVTF